MEFGVTDDVEAIRLSIGKSIEEGDYLDAEVVFAELRQRYGDGAIEADPVFASRKARFHRHWRLDR